MNEKPITRHQGETYPVELNMLTAGVALPITGFAFELTVNAKAAPLSSDPALFSSTGAIMDADAGIVHFPITANNADFLGRYYHRVTMTDASGKTKAVLYGPYLLLPRLQPADAIGQVFIPAGDLGTYLPMDSSELFRIWCDASDDTESRMVYRERDGVPVVAWEGPQGGAWWTFEFAGAQATGGPWGPTGVWEYTLLLYWNTGARILFRSDLYDICHTLMSCSSDRIRLECESYHPYGWDNSSENVNFMFGTVRTVPEWAAIRYRIDCDTPQVSGKVWYPADPVNWLDDEPVAWEGQVGLATYPLKTILPVRFECQGGGPGAVFDIARIGWERLTP